MEYRFVALSQVLSRYFIIGLISLSYLKAHPLFTSEQQKLTVIIALKASGRDCTNNNELLHKIGGVTTLCHALIHIYK